MSTPKDLEDDIIRRRVAAMVEPGVDPRSTRPGTLTPSADRMVLIPAGWYRGVRLSIPVPERDLLEALQVPVAPTPSALYDTWQTLPEIKREMDAGQWSGHSGAKLYLLSEQSLSNVVQAAMRAVLRP